MNMTIKEAMNSDSVNFKEFYDAMIRLDKGFWDGVNSEECILEDYIPNMIAQDVKVSHILKAIEDNPSSRGIYKIWLGNSMETPTPIETKSDLIEALELRGNELKMKLKFEEREAG